jgi:phosphate starvation-inducible protein PhoH and related proteins
LGRCSGLVEARYVLGEVEGLAFCYFNENDVVRHHLVRLIIKAYQQHVENETRPEGSSNNGKGSKN